MSACVIGMNRMIPTCVTELGETLMNEVDLQDDPESEILTAVSSLDSDCWSASSCAGDSLISLMIRTAAGLARTVD